MVQQKNIALCIVLSLVTCGIYGIYWFITLTNDLNTATGEEGTSGGVAFLLSLVTCSIYMYYWAFKCGEKVDKIRQQNGEAGGSNGVLYLILCLFGLGIVTYALVQSELNKVAQA